MLSPQPSAPIFLVDDSGDDLFLLQRLFAKAGIAAPIEVFDDAADVLPRLRASLDGTDKNPLPCVIFTDLKMPRMNGIEFARWLRGEPGLGGIAVVMVSSSEEPRDVEEARASGINHYYAKFPLPLTIARIVAKARGVAIDPTLRNNTEESRDLLC